MSPPRKRRTRKSASSNDLIHLIRRTAMQNTSAFAMLYGLTNRRMYKVGLNIVRSRALADDLLQEAYLKIWRGAHSYDPQLASPVTWMTAIVRNCAIDLLRKQQPEPVDDEKTLAELVQESDPVHEYDLSRKRALAFAAIRELSDDKRRMIVLAYLRNESREQIARRFGMPVNTIKTHLRRALNEIAAKLRDGDCCGSTC